MMPLNKILEHIANPRVSVENILNTVYIVAQKLEDEAFKTWIKLEINGYRNEEDVPEYRYITDEIEIIEPGPVYDNEYSLAVKEILGKMVMKESIIELENKLLNGQVRFDIKLSQHQFKLLLINNRPLIANRNVCISNMQVKKIRHSVKQKIVDWLIREEDKINLLMNNYNEKGMNANSNNISQVFYAPVNGLSVQQATSGAVQGDINTTIDWKSFDSDFSKLDNLVKNCDLDENFKNELINNLEFIKAELKNAHKNRNVSLISRFLKAMEFVVKVGQAAKGIERGCSNNCVSFH